MKKKYFDPLIPRKAKLTSEIQYDNNNLPLPSVVEISESGTCNRKCSFCPRSAPDFLDIKEFISEDLIVKLSRELSKYEYSGIFLFSGFVEPMLDVNIYNLVAIVRKNLPKARIEPEKVTAPIKVPMLISTRLLLKIEPTFPMLNDSGS